MSFSRKYTPEDVAKWEALLDEGYGYKHVGKVFGVHRDTVTKYLPGRCSRYKPSEEDIANWKAALEEGYGYLHVSELYGVDRGTVRKHLPGLGWTPEQITKHATFMKHHNAKMRKVTYV